LTGSCAGRGPARPTGYNSVGQQVDFFSWCIAAKQEPDYFFIGQKNGKDMADRSQNLQDQFLNAVRKQKIPLTIFLVNGVKLTGVVTSFDNFCVLLRRDGHAQLVYKHAISTIMPGQPVSMFDNEDVAAKAD
jgi:host factor-I protein